MGINVSFLGLGTMGAPMAGHLARAGHQVTVYNRTVEKADKWLTGHRTAGEGGHSLASTPVAAAKGAEIVFLCLGNDDDVRAVVMGPNGVLAGMDKGAILVDHTTTSAMLARELAEEAGDHDLGFVDAPLSGGEAGAQAGQLTVMCGGEQAHFDVAEPVIQSYAKMVKLLGPAGAGQTCKMVNQICLAGTIQGLAEALTFALAAGLDADDVLETLSKGAAQSWQMDNRWQTMAKGEFDFGFAVDWMRKDLGFVLEEAKRLGLELPVASMVDGFYEDVQDMGGARNDTSSLIRRFRG